MKTEINHKVFDGEGFPVYAPLLENITEENRQLITAMMKSGHYQNGIMVHKFLRDDLSINLEKLELAVILAVSALEANAGDSDVTLQLRGLEEYYKIRGIFDNEYQKREERTFIIGFVSAVAGEVSRRDTLVVKYVY